jgi:hypothetical protein
MLEKEEQIEIRRNMDELFSSLCEIWNSTPARNQTALWEIIEAKRLIDKLARKLEECKVTYNSPRVDRFKAQTLKELVDEKTLGLRY